MASGGSEKFIAYEPACDRLDDGAGDGEIVAVVVAAAVGPGFVVVVVLGTGVERSERWKVLV